MKTVKTWVEISRSALTSNVSEFRRLLGSGIKIAGVVKANAYGHGLLEVVRAVQAKVDYWAVDSVSEALQVRTIDKDKNIVVLGYTPLDQLEILLNKKCEQVVSNIETLIKLKALTAKKKRFFAVHLKIETGTSRQGILLQNLPEFLRIIKGAKYLKLAGVSTHFANVEDTTDHSYARQQLAHYESAVKLIEKAGFKNFIRHTACSAAAIAFPQSRFDMIRLGISLYGLWSSPETKLSAKEQGIKLNLLPALTWKTRVAQLQTLPKGTAVSYGCLEKLTRKSRLAVLPVGYYDGYDRGFSSLGRVLIRGQYCRIIGRVCMNMVIADVTNVKNIKLEDEVILLGRQGTEVLWAEDLARVIGTINYEVVTRINPLLPRLLLK